MPKGQLMCFKHVLTQSAFSSLPKFHPLDNWAIAAVW
jgi:hypothetical protein